MFFNRLLHQGKYFANPSVLRHLIRRQQGDIIGPKNIYKHSLSGRSFLTLSLQPALTTFSAAVKNRHISLLELEKSYAKFSARKYSSKKFPMEKHCVVPDVISCVPQEVITVCYPSGASVEQGNVLTPTLVKDQPTVTWKADDSSYYTLCMTDPDAPSRADPKFREWHHWLVGNIPGGDVSKGETLSAYIGSGPPEGTGLHRYVFLIYKQNGKLTFDEKRLPNNSGDDRGGFKIAAFANKYNLGDPVAGNFYQAEFDDYVPILYKQLGA